MSASRRVRRVGRNSCARNIRRRDCDYTNIFSKSKTACIKLPDIRLEGVPDTATDLKVHVRAGGLTRAAHVGDDLPLLYVLAGRDNDARSVRVESLASISVLEHHVLPVSTVPASSLGDHHIALGGGKDGCS